MMSVMLYSCIFCVALSMDLFVFMLRCVCELFGETIRNIFGCVCYFLVKCELCVVGGAQLDRPCLIFHRMCVLCLWPQ